MDGGSKALIHKECLTEAEAVHFASTRGDELKPCSKELRAIDHARTLLAKKRVDTEYGIKLEALKCESPACD